MTDAWNMLLSLVNIVHYKHVSFYLKDKALAHKWLHLLHLAVVDNTISADTLRWLVCFLEMEMNEIISLLCEMMNRLEGLVLVLCSSESSETPNLPIEISELIDCAGESSVLTNLLLLNRQTGVLMGQHEKVTEVPLIYVDLGQLTRCGLKSWTWLWFENINVDCESQLSHSLKIDVNLLQLVDCTFSYSVLNLLRCCRPISLHSNSYKITEMWQVGLM